MLGGSSGGEKVDGRISIGIFVGHSPVTPLFGGSVVIVEQSGQRREFSVIFGWSGYIYSLSYEYA